MLASNAGLPYRVAIYLGKEKGGDSDKSLGYRVVTLSLLDHHVFFDNFFLSYQLMKTLFKKASKQQVPFKQIEQMVAH